MVMLPYMGMRSLIGRRESRKAPQVVQQSSAQHHCSGKKKKLIQVAKRQAWNAEMRPKPAAIEWGPRKTATDWAAREAVWEEIYKGQPHTFFALNIRPEKQKKMPAKCQRNTVEKNIYPR